MLDGGQILYQGIELIKGEPLSMRFQVIGNQIGIMALIILMSVAFYNDIFNLY
jgi:regulator of sigma E protease